MKAGQRAAGGVLVVAGPDGSGKSTLVDAVCRDALGGYPVLRLHHRPGFLPVLTTGREAGRRILPTSLRRVYLDASLPESELASLIGSHLLGPRSSHPSR